MPIGECRLFDRRGGSDARIRDQDVKAAKFESTLIERGLDLLLIGNIAIDRSSEIRAKTSGKVGMRIVQSFGVAVGNQDTSTVKQQMSRSRQPDAACPAGNERDSPCQRLGFWHALLLRLFKGPVFNCKRLAFSQRHVSPDSACAPHDVDGIAIKLARQASGGLVRSE